MNKKKFFKYIGLILGLLILSSGIYYFILLNEKKEVNKTPDVLAIQYDLEEKYMSDFKSNNYTIDNPKIVLNPYNNSPLTAIIMFKTDNEEKVEIIIEGKDDKTTISHVFDLEKEHILPIYGLYANQENVVTIKVGDTEKDIIIKTAPLPEDFVLTTKVFANKEKVSNDLIFVSPAAKGNITAYDINGDVRWYMSDNYSWDIQRLDNGHLLLGSNRVINQPYYSVGLVEIDLSGKIYKEYTLPGGYHHDVFEMEDGNLLVASNDFDRGTVEDLVVLLNRETGKIEKTWDIAKALPKEKGKSENWIEHDWFHNNSVWYDEKTNSITLSGRHLDAVINIDYDNGDLNWIIGDSTNWGEDMQKYFFTPINDELEWQWSQHAAMVLPDGNIFVFDNGNNKSKIESEYVLAKDGYSRGVIYKIDTDKMTIDQVWQYGKERGSYYYSPYICDVDYYKDNHYLVHSGGIGEKDGVAVNKPALSVKGATLRSITTELLNDEIILELELPSNFYRAEKLSLYSNNNLKFGKPEKLGTLGKTETCGETTKVLFSSKKIPTEYKISFNKEIDRLIFNGNLKKGTKTYIVLNSLSDQKVYQVHVSKTPYTAMCIGIFEDNKSDDIDELDINYYINNEGLSGKYDLYLMIDDKLYNTNEYVEFN